MRVITTHVSADFDAFASALCAVRLYPGYQVVLPGSLEITVRRFLAETKLPFPELKLRDARRSLFEHVVIVDTHNPRRLGEVWQLIEDSGCRVTVIDHHETDGSTITGDEQIQSRPVGPLMRALTDLGAKCTALKKTENRP